MINKSQTYYWNVYRNASKRKGIFLKHYHNAITITQYQNLICGGVLLGIWCPCSGLSGVGSIPGPGISACLGNSQKKNLMFRFPWWCPFCSTVWFRTSTKSVQSTCLLFVLSVSSPVSPLSSYSFMEVASSPVAFAGSQVWHLPSVLSPTDWSLVQRLYQSQVSLVPRGLHTGRQGCFFKVWGDHWF